MQFRNRETEPTLHSLQYTAQHSASPPTPSAPPNTTAPQPPPPSAPPHHPPPQPPHPHEHLLQPPATNQHTSNVPAPQAPTANLQHLTTQRITCSAYGCRIFHSLQHMSHALQQ